MPQQYFCLLTKVGEAKDAKAKALGTSLKFTEMAVGDGGGALPVPDPNRTTLVNQVRRALLNSLTVDPKNPNQVIAEQILPEDVGGWWVRELGLYDADGDLVAIGNCAESYKPQLAQGSGRTQRVRMVFICSSAATVQLKVDPSVVLATREFVESQDAAHVAATDPHPQYLTAAEGDTKIQAAVTALVNAAPATLDTLAELALALGNDKNFATTITNALALKAPAASPVLTGNVGIGTTGPNSRLEIRDDNVAGGPVVTLHNRLPGAGNTPYVIGGVWGAGYRDVVSAAYVAGIDFVRESFANGLSSRGQILFYTGEGDPVATHRAAGARMRLDPDGNLLVGATSGTCHKIAKGGNTSDLCLDIAGTSVMVRNASSAGYNASAYVLAVGKITTTQRSINAEGTVNASGADYAEYMTKADGCGDIAKGAIVGVDADGKLTDKWAAAVSFVVKSTDPSYVGGDTWGNEAALGMKRPVEPAFVPPEYVGAPHPGEAPAEDASDEVRAAYDAALVAHQADQHLHAEAVAAARADFDAVIMPAYQQALTEFNAVLEAARQKVDRIAYCGQVPVNVLGAKPGEFILPDNGGTPWDLMADPEVPAWFKKFARSVGVVQNILPDGRANVRVKVV